ncbi:MAG: WGR domain-containing protein [Cyanobacteria bacterium P01_A01_bin.40]
MYQLEKWQHSSWQKDTRFYSLELCQDLFGNWIIKRTWGSAVKQDFGRSNSTVCPDYQTGLLWYEKQASRRRKRGYSAITLKEREARNSHKG